MLKRASDLLVICVLFCHQNALLGVATDAAVFIARKFKPSERLRPKFVAFALVAA